MPPLFSVCSFEHAISGSTGTVLATLLLFPLEHLKTLLQVDPEAYRGLYDVLRRVLRDEGASGLYTGCTPMLQTVGSSNFLYFLFQGLKEPLARAFGREEGIIGSYETLASSALAGALNMVFTEPLWKASVVAQASASGGQHHVESSQEAPRARGVFSTVQKIWVQEGARALWRGLGTSLWLVANPVIQFFAYDFLKAIYVHAAEISAAEAFVIGAFAKALATLITFPLQVAQSRLRVCKEGSMVQCLRELHAKGVGAMYYGLVPKLLQTVSHAALMFAFYEKIHWVIRRLSRRGVSQLRKMKYLKA